MVISRKRKRQTGDFLNCYDFAYAGRGTTNQAPKFALGITKAATNSIKNTVKQRTNQIISQGGKKMESLLPKVFRGVIEDIYQTPFRLPRNFGKQQLNKSKNNIDSNILLKVNKRYSNFVYYTYFTFVFFFIANAVIPFIVY